MTEPEIEMHLKEIEISTANYWLAIAEKWGWDIATLDDRKVIQEGMLEEIRDLEQQHKEAMAKLADSVKPKVQCAASDNCTNEGTEPTNYGMYCEFCYLDNFDEMVFED